MKKVFVRDMSEFGAMIKRRRISTAFKKMFEKRKKQQRIRFAVRTPPVNCKPVKKVLPSCSSIGSNDPVYDVMLLADHDGEEVESAAPSMSNNYNDDVTHEEAIIPQLPAIVLRRKQQKEDEILAALEPMLCAIDRSLFMDYNGYINNSVGLC
ncbi:hypothetical protein CTI12_AA224000 [Artemisia annua]|uniref:Uncharacterized protein n=1 Tax=Artemisia annua TaxID=35608 RepID=A0A2U1NVY1_ARTAN|nr:hypothetical protein CTI12_AA224000 [Artemisia annua]